MLDSAPPLAAAASDPRTADLAQRLADPYNVRRERERIRQREQARTGQEVGPLPEVADPALRAEVTSSLKRFCEVVFPRTFVLAWSDDHLEVLATTEKILREGGQLALAMPRGSGKSSIYIAAVLWAVVTGLRKTAVLLAANRTKCRELLDGVREALEDNDVLLDLFPEVCHPIRCLEGQTNRAGRQMVDGERTNIVWTGFDVRLPMVAGSVAAGAYILIRSLTSEGVRGILKSLKGAKLRPDLVLIDDPQTDRSAKSQNMTRERMGLLSKALMGLAGPGVTLAVLAAVTVIRNGDLAAQILDREKRPEWRGRKYVLLKSFPERLDLWQEYARRRDDELRTSDAAIEAVAWLRAHYSEARRGGVASWPQRFEAHQIDGLHFAMDLYTSSDPDKVAAFHSEYQNAPLDDQASIGLKLEPLEIAKRVIELPRHVVPEWAGAVTAFIDVQQKLLVYTIVAWGEQLRGHVVDYGAWPDQKQPQFSRRQPPVPLSSVYRGLPIAACVRRGLTDLLDHLATRALFKPDGTPAPINRIGVDVGDGNLVDALLDGCHASPHHGIVWPSRGAGITEDSLPIREWKIDVLKGETRGLRWMRSRMKGKRALQFVMDVNFWKSVIAGKLAAPLETAGVLTLYGSRGTYHGQLAQHCTAETFDRKVSAKSGRVVDVWRLVNESNENELWDCLVGSAALAASLGLALDPQPAVVAAPVVEEHDEPAVSYIKL
jgi:hypothetical protein